MSQEFCHPWAARKREQRTCLTGSAGQPQELSIPAYLRRLGQPRSSRQSVHPRASWWPECQFGTRDLRGPRRQLPRVAPGVRERGVLGWAHSVRCVWSPASLPPFEHRSLWSDPPPDILQHARPKALSEQRPLCHEGASASNRLYNVCVKWYRFFKMQPSAITEISCNGNCSVFDRSRSTRLWC